MDFKVGDKVHWDHKDWTGWYGTITQVTSNHVLVSWDEVGKDARTKVGEITRYQRHDERYNKYLKLDLRIPSTKQDSEYYHAITGEPT